MEFPTSIIVYRNPLEQAFWEGFMSSPLVFPIICGLVGAGVLCWVISTVFDKIQNRMLRNVYGSVKSKPLRASYWIRRNEGTITLVLFVLFAGGIIYSML